MRRHVYEIPAGQEKSETLGSLWDGIEGVVESRKLWRLERPRHFAVITRGKEIDKRYKSANLTQDSTLTSSSPPRVILVSPLEQKLNIFLPLTRKRRIRTQKRVFFFLRGIEEYSTSLLLFLQSWEWDWKLLDLVSDIAPQSQILEETDWCLAIGYWLNMVRKLEKITRQSIPFFSLS